jgi:hypothetical protein
MANRGEIKSDWKAAAKKPLPSGRDPDDAMEEIDSSTTKLPKPRRSYRPTFNIPFALVISTTVTSKAISGDAEVPLIEISPPSLS